MTNLQENSYLMNGSNPSEEKSIDSTLRLYRFRKIPILLNLMGWKQNKVNDRQPLEILDACNFLGFQKLISSNCLRKLPKYLQIKKNQSLELLRKL